ncbi:MAG: hypothetical protein KJO07_17145, partial [Deltaproteobacteria bacterium]|nr:hypothetical protein [Deltaproteobacteria bacterium]
TMSSYSNQSGFPVLRAQVRCQGNRGQITVSQRPYRWAVMPARESEQRWTLPVCVAFGGERSERRTECTWLSERTASMAVAGCPRWVFPLAGASAYAVAEGDALAAVDVAELSSREHAALVHSAWAAIEEGRAPRAAFSLLADALGSDDQHLLELTLDIVVELLENTRGQLRKRLIAAVGEPLIRRAMAVGFRKLPTGDYAGRTARARMVRVAAVDLGHRPLMEEAERIAGEALAGRPGGDRGAIIAALETFAAGLEPQVAELMVRELRGERRMEVIRDRVGTLASITRQDTAARVLELLHGESGGQLFLPLVLSSYSSQRGSAAAALRFLRAHPEYLENLGDVVAVRARFSAGLCSQADAKLLERVVPVVGDDDAGSTIRACAGRAALLRRLR